MIKVTGIVSVYELPRRFDRPVPVQELSRVARLVTRRTNLVTDAGLEAWCAAVAGCVGVPVVGGHGVGPDSRADVLVTSVRVTGVAGPTAPSPSDTELEGAYGIQGWPSGAPSEDVGLEVDGAAPEWNGRFPFSVTGRTWYAPGGRKFGPANDNVLFDARVFVHGSGYRLSLKGRTSSGVAALVWLGEKTGTTPDGVYTALPGFSPSSYTVTTPGVYTWGGEDINVEYPGSGRVVFSGFVPANAFGTSSVRLTEQGLFTANQTLFARSIIGNPPTGTVTFVGSVNPADGDTVEVSDGAASVVFEFDDDDSVTPGNTPVLIEASSANTMTNFCDALNASVLLVRGVRTGLSPVQASLTHVNVGTVGNAALVVSGANLSVTGMSGGVLGYLKIPSVSLQITHELRIEAAS